MTSTLPPLVQAFSGGIGSASANAISYPLDLIATRLRTTNSKRLKGNFSSVAHKLKLPYSQQVFVGCY